VYPLFPFGGCKKGVMQQIQSDGYQRIGEGGFFLTIPRSGLEVRVHVPLSMEPDGDEGKQTQKGRHRAFDRVFGVVLQGFQSQVGSGFLERGFDVPTRDIVFYDLFGIHLHIGGEEAFFLEPILLIGVSDEDPTDRHGIVSDLIP